MPEIDSAPAVPLGTVLDAYIVAPRHPCLDQLTEGNCPRGTHWVGYRYLDFSAGVSTKVEFFCDVSEQGVIIRRAAPQDFGALYIFRSGVLDDLPVVPLSRSQRATLGLPAVPEWLAIYHRDESEPETMWLRGRALNASGMSERAVPVLLECRRLIPNAPEVLFELLFALNATGRFGEFFEVMEDVSDDSPVMESAMVWREIGYALQCCGDHREASQAFGRALALLSPDDKQQAAEIAFNAGTAALEAGETETGLRYWTQAWHLAEVGSPVYEQLKKHIKVQPPKQ